MVSAGLILALAVYAVYLQPCLSAGQQRWNSWPKIYGLKILQIFFSYSIEYIATWLKNSLISFLSELNKDE